MSRLFKLSWVFWLVLIGCKSRENIQKTNYHSKIGTVSKNDFVRNNVIYKTFSIKGKAEYSDKKQRQQFQYKIQGYRDSLLWMSLSVMGIEGVRVQIRRDSVWVLNRLKKQVLYGSYRDLEKLGGVPLALGWAQELLVGNTPALILEADFQPGSSTATWKQGTTEVLLLLNPVNQKLVEVISKQPKRTATINYAQFSESLPILPVQMSFKITGEEYRNIALQHQKIELDASDSPNCSFFIPGDYARVPIQ